jgi:tetratricopeptide (TPR) repeat protein
MKLNFLCLTLLLATQAFAAKPKKKSSAVKPPKPPVRTVADELQRLETLRSKNAIKPHYLWSELSELYDNKKTRAADRVEITRQQAIVLYKEGYPVAASLNAIDALEAHPKPLSDRNDTLWKILRLTATKGHGQIQYLLEQMAEDKGLGKSLPPYFKTDWNYYLANASLQDNKRDKAIAYLNKVNIADRYYMPAQYQLALTYAEEGKFKEAEVALKAILHPSSRKLSQLSLEEQEKMWNYANMALARIHYQQRDFLKSAQHYRKITRDSHLFYDALFEQSWALFMSGNPLHSLGTLYGVHSPYFPEKYNPESKILESIVYYWMCRYEDSRNSLADFAEKYGKSLEGLSEYLQRQRLTQDAAYDLFENLVSGVSESSLGIQRSILTTAAEKDSMFLIRDQLASVMAERDRLRKIGIDGNTSGMDAVDDRLAKIEARLKKNLGSQFIVELKSLKNHFEDLYSQAQFLYIELLMSEKEQIFGRELHVSSKMQNDNLPEKVRGWSRNTQSWKDDEKYEFWWDEIGYQIVSVTSQCQTQAP